MPQIQSKLMLHKKLGETPFECLERFRLANPEYKDLPMTYAGRLDPMAEGALLVLVGEECKKKEKYLGLDKEYEVEILFGFATDSYDILGMVTKKSVKNVDVTKAKKEIQKFVGRFSQKYPKYSSMMIAASKGAKSKQVEIYSIKFLSQRKVAARALLQTIERRIARVTGLFRQKETVKLWRKHLKGRQGKFQVIKIKVKCSSGTYMRSLSCNLGKKLSVSALALSIKRTRIIKFD